MHTYEKNTKQQYIYQCKELNGMGIQSKITISYCQQGKCHTKGLSASDVYDLDAQMERRKSLEARGHIISKGRGGGMCGE